MGLKDLFTKKEDPAIPPIPPPDEPESMDDTPTDKVLFMRQQGLSNNQIVSDLQREGYQSNQVFDAMNQADIKGGVNAMQMDEPQEVPYPENPMQMDPQPMQQDYSYPPQDGQAYAPDYGYPDQQYPMEPQTTMPVQPQEPPQDRSSPDNTTVNRIEEIAEAIIDEKWDELVKNVNKIIEWKSQTETKIARIEQEFADIKQDFDKLHKGIIDKVGEYDKNIMAVGTEVKAMEKVFQKVLPTFTENVNELSRITTKMKTKR